MSPRSLALAVAASCLLGLGAVACERPAQRRAAPLETVEVPPAIDADFSTAGDLKAVQRAPEVAGVLPGGVPPDLPLFVPSSVIDFGELGDGRAWVELDTPRQLSAVSGWLGERLPAAGWTTSAVGGGGLRAAKGGREVTYRLTDLAPGTRIRLEYRPQP